MRKRVTYEAKMFHRHNIRRAMYLYNPPHAVILATKYHVLKFIEDRGNVICLIYRRTEGTIGSGSV